MRVCEDARRVLIYMKASTKILRLWSKPHDILYKYMHSIIGSYEKHSVVEVSIMLHVLSL